MPQPMTSTLQAAICSGGGGHFSEAGGGVPGRLGALSGLIVLSVFTGGGWADNGLSALLVLADYRRAVAARSTMG